MGDSRDFFRARDFLLKHRTDYEGAYRDFTWPRLEEFNWALDYFDAIASGNTRTALWVVEESGTEIKLSFADMAARSNQVASWLQRQGVRQGDRVLLMLSNQPQIWDVLLATCKLGAVIIPASLLLGAEDLRERLHLGEVRHVIAESDLSSRFASVEGGYTRICTGDAAPGWLRLEEAYSLAPVFHPERATRAGDSLFLYFTSGTTAKPKLVQHSHASYPAGHLSTMYWLGLQPGDLHWNISSPGWGKHAWSNFFGPWNAEATVFAFHYTRFQPKRVLELLERKPVATLCAPPTVWRMLIQEDLASYRVGLREAASAGEPLNPEVIERVRTAWGVDIRDGYGQTETTAMIGNSPGQPIRVGSMGRPLPGYRIELLDAGGRTSSDGEICVALSPHPLGLMQGYAGDEMRTGDVMRGNYYRTGDIGVRDEDGYITYVGRSDDIFKSADYRISPFELESVLLKHPAVAEAAVVPTSDPVRLSVPKAFIALTPGYSPSPEVARSIFAFIRRSTAPYKRIRRLEFAELPKTVSGKIRRAELRAQQERAGLEFREEDFADV